MSKGATKTAIILVVVMLTNHTSGGQSLNSHRYQFKGDEKSLLVRTESRKIILNYSLSELDVSTVINENGSWYRVSIPGHNPSTKTGSPELPVFSRIIAIPEGGGITIKISD
ncbi:MAG TPA: C25 family peptidase propeptide domain-containing protein, partial [Bacteroidales bacterium]|nr:C25 family peptidase propeptide domain-containing protein [Bacteroidales bacterium]